MTSSSSSALVLLVDGAEEMETAIIVDVLRRADVSVTLAGIDGDGPVTCSRGMQIVPDTALEEVSTSFDMLVLPGGAEGTDRLCGSAAVAAVLRRQEAEGGVIAAICAAPRALAVHGICKGHAMTSHPSVREAVAAHGCYREEVVVEDRALITSRGPGTAFEFALTLVARLFDPSTAKALRGPMMLPAR